MRCFVFELGKRDYWRSRGSQCSDLCASPSRCHCPRRKFASRLSAIQVVCQDTASMVRMTGAFYPGLLPVPVDSV
jgi:hypothetical protein